MAKQTRLGKLRSRHQRLVEAFDLYKMSVERAVTGPQARENALKTVASISSDLEQLRRFLLDLPELPKDTRFDRVYRRTLPTIRNLLGSVSEEFANLPDLLAEGEEG
jgi:hypothetical protein